MARCTAPRGVVDYTQTTAKLHWKRQTGNTAMSPILDLDIAQVFFCIHLPDPAWLQPLAQRYRLFVGAGPRPWQVRLVVDEGVDPAARSSVITGWVTHFHIQGHRGWIDLARRTAQVSTPSLARAHSALERVLTYACLHELPRTQQGLLLHAAGVVLEGQAHVFFGPSGAGKSTVARLAQGAGQVLSDEGVILRRRGEGMEALSTPFWGLSTELRDVRFVQARAPVHALYQLVKAAEFGLERLSPAAATMALLASEKVTTERTAAADDWLAAAAGLLAQIPVYRLAFRPTPALWPFLTATSTCTRCDRSV